MFGILQLFVFPVLIILGAVLSCIGLWFFLRLFQAFGMSKILGEIIGEVTANIRDYRGKE